MTALCESPDEDNQRAPLCLLAAAALPRPFPRMRSQGSQSAVDIDLKFFWPAGVGTQGSPDWVHGVASSTQPGSCRLVQPCGMWTITPIRPATR